MNPSMRKPGNSGPKRTKSFKPPPMQQQYPYGQYSPGPQLFDDTSGTYPNQYPQNPPPGPTGWNQSFVPQSFPGQQLLTDPMASMAMQYGQNLAGQGKVIVEEKLEKYVSLSKMKYYFAVDTGYVTKKLALLFFPFTHSDWAVHYSTENEPVPPRYDVNAPDLYIPTMAFVTYVLTAGFILGSQNRFSPEQLGMQASSALGWSVVEVAVLFFALYLLSSSSSVKVFDLIAFCSYKYVCMVAILLACIGFKSAGYYAVLGYSSLSLGFFLAIVAPSGFYQLWSHCFSLKVNRFCVSKLYSTFYTLLAALLEKHIHVLVPSVIRVVLSYRGNSEGGELKRGVHLSEVEHKDPDLIIYRKLRTLRVLILPKTTADHYSTGGRHNSYLLLAICLVQPVLMYILTRHLVSYTNESI